MCGFAAFFERGCRFPDPLLSGASEDLFHRGPDSGGRVSKPGWALVFRRLAILDPRADADQPMTDASGRCTLVFNGEIYNFRDLRTALEAEGVTFRTHGDTEVLLQGYLRWGEAVVDRLEGMYAFVIVDRQSGCAFAARDPFGIKPLYCTRWGKTLALASEMRPLLRLRPAEVEPATVGELLTFSWAAGANSNLKGIERVPGGTALNISLATGQVTRRRFFDVLDTLRPDEDMSATEAGERVHAALVASVKAHLASDVGYTLELSGGVDSSLVAALASRETPWRISSFGIFLGHDDRFDESRWRQPVAERYHLNHHEVPLSNKDFADALPRAVRHMEGPVPHGGCVLLMLLCDQARKVSKVILTGEGADELFGGYERYGLWPKLRWQERLGRWLPTRLLPERPPFLGVRRLAGRDAAVYSAVYHDFLAMHALFPGVIPPPGAREAASARFTDFRDRLHAVDQIAYLESVLVRQDKMSMAASVEARVPFVHLPLARVVNALPRKVKTPGGVTKPLLKRIAEPLLPHDLIHRRKIGLHVDYDDWLSDQTGLGCYLELLTEPGCRLAQFAERDRLREVVTRYRRGHRQGLPVMFNLVNVEMWLRSLDEVPRPAKAGGT